MSFADSLPVILAFEGGKVDDPRDRGGRTAYGVTQGTYDAWQAARTPPGAERDVWMITPDEVAAIYRTRYWDAIRGDEMAAISGKLALCVFDSAVSHGVGIASRMLQITVNAMPDGVVGPQTIACVEKYLALVPESAMLARYLQRRVFLYRNLILHDRTQERFAKGWRHRVNTLAAKVSLPPLWTQD